MANDPNPIDRILSAITDEPWIAMAVAAGLIIIAIAKFTDALQKIGGFLNTIRKALSGKPAAQVSPHSVPQESAQGGGVAAGGNINVDGDLNVTTGVSPLELKEILESVLQKQEPDQKALDKIVSLSSDLGVTTQAFRTFFKSLGEAHVPVEDLDAKLREIADRHKGLLEELRAFRSDDPDIVALKKRAAEAIDAGEHDRADALLAEAVEKDLAAADRMRETADRRGIAAAASQAQRGEIQLTRFAYAAAAEHFEAAADIVPDGASELRASYLSWAGLAASNGGQYSAAEPLYERALAIHETALGPEHPDTATSLNNLALHYINTGRYEAAEPLYERALAILETALGPEHPDTATSLNNLALLYINTGRYEAAEPLCERALAIRKTALGPEHPDTATSLDNLAALYDSQGRYEAAEPLYERALAIHETALGPEHPDTATSLNNLAALYINTGDYVLDKCTTRNQIRIDRPVFRLLPR